MDVVSEGEMMPEKILFESIKLQNFLSFGSESMELELKPLNILIGPNGSGKSNLIEAIDFIRSTPTDLQDVIREKGGGSQFIWKGISGYPIAEIVFRGRPKSERTSRKQG